MIFGLKKKKSFYGVLVAKKTTKELFFLERASPQPSPLTPSCGSVPAGPFFFNL